MGQPWHQTHDVPAVGEGAGLISSLCALIYKVGTRPVSMLLKDFVRTNEQMQIGCVRLNVHGQCPVSELLMITMMVDDEGDGGDDYGDDDTCSLLVYILCLNCLLG